jgi:hypothetical protein
MLPIQALNVRIREELQWRCGSILGTIPHTPQGERTWVGNRGVTYFADGAASALQTGISALFVAGPRIASILLSQDAEGHPHTTIS